VSIFHLVIIGKLKLMSLSDLDAGLDTDWERGKNGSTEFGLQKKISMQLVG